MRIAGAFFLFERYFERQGKRDKRQGLSRAATLARNYLFLATCDLRPMLFSFPLSLFPCLFSLVSFPLSLNTPRFMSIATKAGDSGQTRLLFGTLVSKADLQVEAYGTIDEFNSFLGVARACCDDAKTCEILEALQRETFVVGAELATPLDKLEKLKQRVTPEMTAVWDGHVAEIETIPGLLDDWALPGATQAGAALDVARVVARRAERCAVRLHDAGEVPNGEVLRYLNRISDLLWLLGRRYEIERGAKGGLRG
ncbi:cob(I)yrinic acid a,c-diamide adenosyltransferase [bacterium]|nr:MAG: cob(I)yrinic acid a,c-diamide adenosyltransferase [bacterium]